MIFCAAVLFHHIFFNRKLSVAEFTVWESYWMKWKLWHQEYFCSRGRMDGQVWAFVRKDTMHSWLWVPAVMEWSVFQNNLTKGSLVRLRENMEFCFIDRPKGTWPRDEGDALGPGLLKSLGVLEARKARRPGTMSDQAGSMLRFAMVNPLL